MKFESLYLTAYFLEKNYDPT